MTPYPDTATHATAFTVEELQVALASLKTGKSVGIDLTSAELLQGLVSVKGGRVHLLEYFNRVLTTRDIPRAWNRPLVVLLPKVPAPTSATQLRPIALGSSASKLFAKMLLAGSSIRWGSRHMLSAPGAEGRHLTCYSVIQPLQVTGVVS